MIRGKLAILMATLLLAGFATADEKAAFPKFEMKEIETNLTVGYAVLTADINGDKKPDIVIVDSARVIWYENPTWKMRTITKGKTKPDNVCMAILDIDGDGKLDVVVGAGWKPTDTANPGTMQWFKRAASLDEEWTMTPIPCDEPTVHRMRVADTDGDGKPEVLMAPLQGRDATAKGNYTDGRPVKILSYAIPADPMKPENWKPKVLSEELHVVHNFWPYIPKGSKQPVSIITASYEGYSAILLDPSGKTRTKLVHKGHQLNPQSFRGASEIRDGYFLKPEPGKWGGSQGAVVATIEPWHGTQVVVYPKTSENGPPTRVVVDDKLRWGHAVAFSDLDGDGIDELVIGVRDDPNPKMGDKFTERRGVRIYKPTDATGTKWDRLVLDEGGVAVEDLVVDDLDGDGKPDIIAVGRATKNCRIYWNKGK